MIFSIATILKMALCISAVNALPQPQATTVPAPNANIPPSTTVDFTGQIGADGNFTVVPAPNTQADQGLQKRVAPIVAVAGIAAAKGAIILTKIAIEVAADTIKNLGEWNQVCLSICLKGKRVQLTSVARSAKHSQRRQHRICGHVIQTIPNILLLSVTTRATLLKTLMGRTVSSALSFHLGCSIPSKKASSSI